MKPRGSTRALIVSGAVALLAAACAPRYRWPAAVYWVDLKRPESIELVTGAKVPCGAGLAMAVYDRLIGCAISRPATVQQHRFPAGAQLSFRWNGTLESARYVERRATPAPGGDGAAVDTRVMSFAPSGDVTSSALEPGGPGKQPLTR